MDELPKVQASALFPEVRERVEQAVEKMMEAVNHTRPGELITGSEEAIRDIGHELIREIYEAALQKRITAAEAAFSPPLDTKTGRKKRNKGKQSTSVLTIAGRVFLRRTWYHSPTSGSEAPMDRLMMADGATMTVGVREISCRLNNDAASFDKAADNLHRAAQIDMSAETLRQLVEEEGRRVIAAQAKGELRPAFLASDCVIPQDRVRRRIYVGVDGVMVPVVTDTEKQKRREKVVMKRRQRPIWANRPKPLPPVRRGADQPFKEFKTITFYNEDNSRRHILLSRCKRPRVSSLVRREARRLKFAEADERVGNVDGASWIPPQLEGPELNLSALGLDFYHLGENVHRAKARTFGEDTPEGTKWSDDLMHTFKHEGYAKARESLLAWRTGLRARKRAAADRLLNYVIERRDMISYPEFVAKGWQIGSGPTEARCKTGTARIKRSGQRWDSIHAEQVAALTNIRDSGQWNLYWTNLIPIKT